MMLCLWNGNYEEHDIAEFYATRSGAEKNLERMELEYAKYPGTVVGDFTCLKVEYHWGRRDQRWTCKCNLCGMVIYQYHVSDWRRGKGRKTTCDCRKEAEIARKEQEAKERAKRAAEREALRQAKKIEKAKKEPHQSKYSSDEWIGKRNGHLTAIGRDGSLFLCRCDCGNELSVRPVELFTRKTKRCCGEPNCTYSSIVHRKQQENKKTGIAYESTIARLLSDKGYNAKVTKGVGDYGVDIIITNADGSLTAVQCKKQSSPVGVDAIQEVYAGGRFYDCTRFSVICDNGFSNNAIVMARKLGVYLCDGEYNPPEDIEKYTESLLPTFHSLEKNKKYYELNGEKKTLGDWCVIYNANKSWVQRQLKDGVSLQIALITPQKPNKPQFTVNGFTGTLTEICNHFGVIKQTVDYRMKQRGMTIEEAIFTPTNSKTA